MIKIVCKDLGYKYIVMGNLLTMQRAEEFLEIFQSGTMNSFKTYSIIESWSKKA